MTPDDCYHAFLGALADHERSKAEAAPSVPAGMMPIAPFDAETEEDERVRAVGVVTAAGGEHLDWIVIKEADGEIFPSIVPSLWRLKGEAAC